MSFFLDEMKKVMIVTDIDYWFPGAGHRARIELLADYLANHIELCVVFSGPERIENSKQKELHYKIIYLERQRLLKVSEYIERFVEVYKDFKPDTCIIEHLRLSFLIDFLPFPSQVILDTHDLVSEKVESFNSFGYQYNHGFNGGNLSFHEELQVFKKFDKILLIQVNEYNIVQKVLGKEKPLLIPHPAEYKRKKLNKRIQRLGFMGSGYEPNIDGISWFISNVLPNLDGNVELHIYGNVCSYLNSIDHERIFIHGWIDKIDLFYSQIDIVINPVRFGAGLKIKNIEALGHGLPLITTTHGASGILEEQNNSFLVANTPTEFITAIEILVLDYERRTLIGDKAYEYVNENFSKNKCFEPLLMSILS